MKVGKLFNARTVITKIYNFETQDTLLAFQKANDFQPILDEMDKADEARHALMDKFANHDKNKKMIVENGLCQMTPENRTQYNQDLDRLFADEVVINLRIPFSLIKEMKLSMADIFAIKELIEE